MSAIFRNVLALRRGEFIRQALRGWANEFAPTTVRSCQVSPGETPSERTRTHKPAARHCDAFQSISLAVTIPELMLIVGALGSRASCLHAGKMPVFPGMNRIPIAPASPARQAFQFIIHVLLLHDRSHEKYLCFRRYRFCWYSRL